MTRRDAASTDDSGDPDRDCEVYTVRYDWDGDDVPSLSIVRAVAAVRGTDPTNMRPLYEVVDTNAVDRLFDRQRRARPDQLSIHYERCEVTVHGNGRVVVASHG